VGVKVLVVDDDQIIRRILRRLLEKRYGCVVREATDGLVAYQAVEAELPDLVFLDVSMPNMTGPELLEKLRGDPRFERLPVAMITATGDRDTVVESIERGVVDYVRKPLRLPSVERRLTDLFRRLRLPIPGDPPAEEG
jgi:putative two-component system response regulator